MKKLSTWIVLVLLGCVFSMVGIQWYRANDTRIKFNQIERLSQRQQISASLVLELERYRRSSASFRRLPEAEVREAKARLKTGLATGLARLEELDPSADERALQLKISDGLSEFLLTSARLEPQLYSRDVYQKIEMRQIHEAMVSNLEQVAASAVQRFSAIQPAVKRASDQAMRVLGLVALVISSLLSLLLVRQYYTHIRPLKFLATRVKNLRGGKLNPPHPRTKLRGLFAEVESLLSDLAHTVEMQRKERHQFLMAIANDLRMPMVALHAGANLIASANEKIDGARRSQAAEIVKRSVFRISKTLDDLTDIVNIDRSEIRLEEEIVDIGDQLEKVSRILGGPGSSHPITVTAPDLPLWVLVDPQRIERVIINLISKITNSSPQGSKIELSVSRVMQESPASQRGIEIRCAQGGQVFSSGPELDVLKHWTSENGFSMLLAHRVVRAHGGTLTAAGLSGTALQFTIRLPEERLANSNASVSFGMTRSGLLERPWVKTMLSEQGVHLGA